MKPKEHHGLSTLQRLLLALLLAAAAGLAIIAPNPPAPLPSTASEDDFSAARALEHVRVIAQKPHPSGSEALAQVRSYITGRLRALRFPVETQGFSFQAHGRNLRGTNILARIPGAGGGTNPVSSTNLVVALVCHYDSVAAGPGAADDGAGVAALLETARALAAGPPLRNDLLLLFTDGEEADLDGAKAFAAANPWMRRIGLVLNFEARGVSGPVFMFETSVGNGRLIPHFAQAAPRPVANSLMYEVYRRMPNDTDLTVFKKAGLPGLNFAFIGEPRHYHAPTDDPAHLSPRSLQHAGSYALALARHFGQTDLARLKAPDAVYFDLCGRLLVWYPGAWVLPLAGVAVVIFLAVAGLSFRRKIASPGRTFFGVLAWGISLAAVALIFGYLWMLEGGVWKKIPSLDGWHLWAAAAAVTLIFTTALNRLWNRWIPPFDLALAGLSWWLLLTLATALWLPGGSFLPVWPLLAGLLAILLTARGRLPSWLRVTILALAALPSVILVSPLVYQFYVALGPASMLVPMLVLVLALAALSLQFEAMLG